MKTVVIDAGHGHNTAGKRCAKELDPGQTREHDLNDRVADRVEAYLAAYDCRILRTDDTTGAKDIRLSARVKAANAAKADIFSFKSATSSAVTRPKCLLSREQFSILGR